MSEEKDDLKSIKVYKFNNVKENWHAFALKFQVIADTRGYGGIIDGTMVPPDEKEDITIAAEDKQPVLREKRKILKARTANKVGYRDLVMSTEGISINIVENAKSEELTKGVLEALKSPFQCALSKYHKNCSTSSFALNFVYLYF